METHRVQKLISNYGYCSRRKAEVLIEEGRVKVNGKTIKIGDQATEQDTITIDNQPIQKEQTRYLMFNKPIGCVTALEDKFQRTIMHYIKINERIFPIGRLDFNTSGLLILTNDGDFANLVMHPRYEVNKTYRVKIKGHISKEAIHQLEKGLMLEDGKTSPAKVKLINDSFFDITIHEGKNRIVRRMMEALGYEVSMLERVRIGKLELGNLKPGTFRDMTKQERELIFKK